jgi:hypothetical protein
MNRKSKSLLVVVASALLMAGCCTSRHTAAWDYKVLRSYDESEHSSLEGELNRLGAEGWTVVSSSWVVDPPRAAHLIFVLKKPKKP